MDDELFKKHYALQQEALNEIKEIIACNLDITATAQECLDDIDLIAAYASQVDLLNPNANEDSRTVVESLPEYQSWESRPDILSRARLWFKER